MVSDAAGFSLRPSVSLPEKNEPLPLHPLPTTGRTGPSREEPSQRHEKVVLAKDLEHPFAVAGILTPREDEGSGRASDWSCE